VLREGAAVVYRVWRGPLTSAALSEALALEHARGKAPTLALETTTIGPVELTVPELVALGVLREEYPLVAARAFFRKLVRRSRVRVSL
jgi:hypothetical protein